MDDDETEQHLHHYLHLKVVSLLGRGAKGVVFLVRSTDSTGEFLALKTISKSLIENNNNSSINGRRICFERDLLKQLRHPLLPRLRGIVDTKSFVGYLIDYCPGRDLNSLRIKQSERLFSNAIIRFYAAELVLALEHLHGLGIVYRDLKPENILIQQNGHLMLVDFDLSTKLPPKLSPKTTAAIQTDASTAKSQPTRSFLLYNKCCNSGISPEDSAALPSQPGNESVRIEAESGTKSNSFVGTEEYVAPEVLLCEGHDFGVDWWSLGVVLYEMLYGVTPFRGSDRKETFFKILTKSPDLVGEMTPLRNLIEKLLEKDPTRRISVERIKGHDFFKGIEWDLVMQMSRPPYIPDWPVNGDDTDEIKDVDMELFLQGVFGDGSVQTHGQCKDHNNCPNSIHTTNNNIENTAAHKGAWGDPCENDKFFVF